MIDKEDYKLFLEIQEDHIKEQQRFEQSLLSEYPRTLEDIYNADINIDESCLVSQEHIDICQHYFNPTVLKELIEEFTIPDIARNESKYETEMTWIRETQKSLKKLGGDPGDWVFMYYTPTISDFLSVRADNLVKDLSAAGLGKKKCDKLKANMKALKNTLIHER